MKLVHRGVKTILNSTLVFLSFTAVAQTGTSRLDAIQIQPQGLCSYSDFTTTGTEIWFKFVAQSEKVAIEMQSEKYGNNQAHIHNLKLYRNTETTEMAQDELPFNAESKKLKINLNAGNLTPGETYYLRADRKPRVHECKKEYCHENGSLNPAQLRLCVQNVSVYIPNDYNGDKPSIAHAFELNRGQLADLDGQVVNDVLMYSPQSSPRVYLGNTFTSYVWAKIDEDSITNDTIHRVDMELVNAQLSEQILKAEEIEGHSSYYVSHNPDGITENKSYSRAIRQNVYNDVDVHYYSNEHGLKMYFVVNENALLPDGHGNHNDINFRFTGGATTELTPNGGLRIKSPVGQLNFEKAIVYYINPAGQNVPMPQSGRIIESTTGVYSVEVVETYPPKRKLIIQLEQDGPTRDGKIPWGTFFGGDGLDAIKNIDAGNDERFYVTGITTAANFPVAGQNIYSGDFGGQGDAFLAQFNKEYEREWATYLGGIYQDAGEGVAHDNLNNVTYLVGRTYGDLSDIVSFPFAQNPNAYMDEIGDIFSFYFSRFDDEGRLTYLTYLPQRNNSDIKVKVDLNGNVFCAGTLRCPKIATPTFGCDALPNGDLPFCRSNPLAYMQDHFSSPCMPSVGNGDLFIMKFSPLMDLTWSTYIGGEGSEWLMDMEIDETHIYLLGSMNGTTSACTSCFPDNTTNSFPIKSFIAGGYNQTTNSEYEGFIIRFKLDGELDWSTFYGSQGKDFLTDGALYNGQLTIGGMTQTNYYHSVEGEPSNNGGFPKKHFGNTGFFQDNYGGGVSDHFVAQFRANTALLWSTFVGGPGDEDVTGTPGLKLDVNELDQLYIAGKTKSGSNHLNGNIDPLDNPYFYSKTTHSDYAANGLDQSDVYVKGFNQDRRHFWTTYLGADAQQGEIDGEYAGGMQTIKERVYVVGWVETKKDFPLFCPSTVNPYCQPDFNPVAGLDAYLCQLKIGPDFYNALNDLSDVSQKFVVYPNPNTGIFVLETKDLTEAITSIEISNQVGQVVKSLRKPKPMALNNYEIDVNELVDGIYFVTFTYENQYYTAKVIKQ